MGSYIGIACTTPAGAGIIDDQAEHPDGLVIVRVNDRWFPIDLCIFE